MSGVVDIRPALLEQLKDLRLPTVRKCYEDTARRAERDAELRAVSAGSDHAGMRAAA
jgi:hypothetical protein